MRCLYEPSSVAIPHQFSSTPRHCLDAEQANGSGNNLLIVYSGCYLGATSNRLGIQSVCINRPSVHLILICKGASVRRSPTHLEAISFPLNCLPLSRSSFPSLPLSPSRSFANASSSTRSLVSIEPQLSEPSQLTTSAASISGPHVPGSSLEVGGSPSSECFDMLDGLRGRRPFSLLLSAPSSVCFLLLLVDRAATAFLS